MKILFFCLIYLSYSIFEYKYSFKAPILDEESQIPFYEKLGNVMLDNTRIRIVPSIQNQKGLIQSRYLTNFKWWEVILDFQIFGHNKIGADGLVFWFTEAKGTIGGTFGRSGNWRGLSVIMDSYDNDHQRNNPMISAFINNETYIYDHDSDGGKESLGNCQIDYRNSPYPSQIRIQYYQNILSVWYLHGHSKRNSSAVLSTPLINGEDNFHGAGVICMRVHDVYLPSKGYFGISAMTGGFGDDHDVYSLTIFSIKNNDIYPSKSKNRNDSQIKEYEKTIEDLEKRQLEFLKKGGKVDEPLIELDEEYQEEDIYSKNLHSIHETNAQFAHQLELIAKLVDEFRQYMIQVGKKHNEKDFEGMIREFNKLKGDIQKFFDILTDDLRRINKMEVNFHHLKSDLHYISDQIHKVYVVSSKNIGFYTLLFLFFFQTVLFIGILLFSTNKKYRYLI